MQSDELVLYLDVDETPPPYVRVVPVLDNGLGKSRTYKLETVLSLYALYTRTR